MNGSCLGLGPKTKVFHHRTPGPRLPTAGKPPSRGRRPPEASGALGQPRPSVRPSVSAPSPRPVYRSVRQSALPVLGRSIGPSVSQSVLPPLGRSIGPSVRQSVSQSVSQCSLPSAGLSARPSVSQSVSQSVLPPLGRSCGPSVSQPPSPAPSSAQSVGPPACRPLAALSVGNPPPSPEPVGQAVPHHSRHPLPPPPASVRPPGALSPPSVRPRSRASAPRAGRWWRVMTSYGPPARDWPRPPHQTPSGRARLISGAARGPPRARLLVVWAGTLLRVPPPSASPQAGAPRPGTRGAARAAGWGLQGGPGWDVRVPTPPLQSLPSRPLSFGGLSGLGPSPDPSPGPCAGAQHPRPLPVRLPGREDPSNLSWDNLPQVLPG